MPHVPCLLDESKVEPRINAVMNPIVPSYVRFYYLGALADVLWIKDVLGIDCLHPNPG